MIKINLPTRTINYPETISVATLIEINKWDIDNKNNWKHITSLVIGCDVSELESADDAFMDMMLGFIIYTLNEREECPMNDLEKLSFGEFVDLEVYLSLNYMLHLESILKIIAPYAQTSAKAMWCIEKYLRWRGVVYKQYSGLFSIDEDAPFEPSTDKMATAKSWYATIVTLSNKNILLMEDVENLGFRKCLNFLAYLKKERLLLENERKKAELINRKNKK